MHIATFEGDFSRCRIEVFKLQLSYFTAIHCVGPVATELLHIEFMCAQSYFLIRIETNTNLAMLDFRMLFQVHYRRNDYGNTCFIICAQQCLAIGHDQVFTFMIQQLRELRRRKNYIFFCTEHDVRTVIVLNNAGRYIFATHIGTGVHVGDKTNSRYRLIDICRKCGKQIAMLIQRYVFQT